MSPTKGSILTIAVAIVTALLLTSCSSERQAESAAFLISEYATRTTDGAYLAQTVCYTEIAKRVDDPAKVEYVHDNFFGGCSARMIDGEDIDLTIEVFGDVVSEWHGSKVYSVASSLPGYASAIVAGSYDTVSKSHTGLVAEADSYVKKETGADIDAFRRAKILPKGVWLSTPLSSVISVTDGRPDDGSVWGFACGGLLKANGVILIDEGMGACVGVNGKTGKTYDMSELALTVSDMLSVGIYKGVVIPDNVSEKSVVYAKSALGMTK